MMRKAQKCRIILPRSHNQSVAEVGLNSDLPDFKTIDINSYAVLPSRRVILDLTVQNTLSHFMSFNSQEVGFIPIDCYTDAVI